jgi:hypothetical protein
MSFAYHCDEPHGPDGNGDSNSYSDWFSAVSHVGGHILLEDEEEIDDDDDYVKEQEYWKKLVHKALKQGNNESVVSSTQDESDERSFSLANPVQEVACPPLWSIPMLPAENPLDSIDPESSEEKSSVASATPSLTNVPFVSLDVLLEPTMTKGALDRSDCEVKPVISLRSQNHVVISSTLLPSCIPSYIYIPPTALSSTIDSELLDIHDPTELLIYHPAEGCWPEPIHRLHRLLLQCSKSSPSENLQLLLADILTCIQQHPETCQVRYPLALPESHLPTLPTYFFPLTYFCLQKCLQGVQVAYDACPEVVGCINDPETGWIPLAFACVSNSSVRNLELIQFVIGLPGWRKTDHAPGPADHPSLALSMFRSRSPCHACLVGAISYGCTVARRTRLHSRHVSLSKY